MLKLQLPASQNKPPSFTSVPCTPPCTHPPAHRALTASAQWSLGLFLLEVLCVNTPGGTFSLPSTTAMPCFLAPRDLVLRLNSGSVRFSSRPAKDDAPAPAPDRDIVLADGSNIMIDPVVRFAVLGFTSRRLIARGWRCSVFPAGTRLSVDARAVDARPAAADGRAAGERSRFG